MRALLDVNVLIALLDAAHLHHTLAVRWLESELKHGWASCPITQNGCLRIMSQPAYPGAQALPAVASRLAEAMAHDSHAFWPDSLSLLDPQHIQRDRLIGHRQITDAYLLALAVENKGRFVSFDARITPTLIPSARPEQLVVLGAAG